MVVAVNGKGDKKYYIDRTTSKNGTPTQSRGSESSSMDIITDNAENFNTNIIKCDEIERINALAGREAKTRGAVETVAKKVNDDVANSITDNTYLCNNGIRTNSEFL